MKQVRGNSRLALLAAVLLFGVLGAVLVVRQPSQGAAQPVAVADSAPAIAPEIEQAERLRSQFEQMLAAYRKIIVLLVNEQSLSAKELEACNRVGAQLFHENLTRSEAVAVEIEALVSSGTTRRFDVLNELLDYVESGDGMYDADRLAFRELLQAMQRTVARDGTLPAIKVHKRIGEDLEALDEIEHLYEKEIHQLFGRFEQRAIQLKRERWEDYVAHLATHYSRDAILKEYGVIVPYSAPKPGSTEAAEISKSVITGYELPPKTLVLTFDDGPHPVYSSEIEAILKQYGIPGVFFNVGRNLGTITADGAVTISRRGEVSRTLTQNGFALGNHSYSHAQLSKQTGESLRAEIDTTDTLLKAVDTNRAPLFRFPYGAVNAEADKFLREAKLKSVLWNIDSLDWADPVPSSIADRVLKTVRKEGRGIILFHDIHERTVKALPAVLERLIAEGYQFAGWDGSFFHVAKAKQAVPQTPITTSYGDSWAIVIGIDTYAKWPQLNYAAGDAQAIRHTLIDHYGFASDHVVSILNGDATRTGILSTFHDLFANNAIKKDDRIFVFFAGHGATRKLSSGRDLGYIIPADSDPARFETDAIPMTEIQNIAESLPAKHVLFVMDACYSGLGLTRGAASWSYLRDNAKRIGRQMLTAGGADQMVADGGPNGHSIFTWTLMQGLEGKGDLNGDGLITATELAAYVAPAVANVSQQTPAFGSLPGSQGGEFIFELRGGSEYLSAQSTQLSSDVIALNSKLDSAATAAHGSETVKQQAASVTVKDLSGGAQQLTLPAPVAISVKQLAQRANDRGLQFYKEQKYAEAEAEFTEALRLRPDFALAANNLGFIYYKQARYKEAAVWFENTIRMDPSRAIAYINLGDAYVKTDEPAKARKAFMTYLELAPTGNNADYSRQQLAHL